jgi:AraC-like DNA-binding protein
MNPFAGLPQDAISISLLESGFRRDFPDGWVHEKVANATIIALAERGRYEVHSNGKRIVAEQGEAFLAQDRQPLRIVHHAPEPRGVMGGRWLHARFVLFHTIDLGSLLSLPPVIDGQVARAFQRLMLALAEPRANHGEAAALKQHSKRSELGFRALSLLAECAPVNPARTAVLQHAERLAPVFSYIDAHLAEPLTVDDLARVAQLSRSRFFSFFQERMQLSPMAYLKEVRLAEARRRLIATDERLSDVAEATGFSGPFHLSREFRRHVGLPPAEFRKRHRTLEV